jgi:hypothetical protein
MITGNSFSKLLQSPFRCGMCGDVAMQDSATADLHQHKDIEHPESSRDCDQKIKRHDALRVIPDEPTPVLRRSSPLSCAIWCSWPIITYSQAETVQEYSKKKGELPNSRRVLHYEPDSVYGVSLPSSSK